MSQPFTMNVSYESGTFPVNLMEDGELGNHTKSKCFEVRIPLLFLCVPGMKCRYIIKAIYILPNFSCSH